MRALKFAFEDEQVFEGFEGGYWNGWLCPKVTEEVHKQIVEYMYEGWDDMDDDSRSIFEEYRDQEPDKNGLYGWGHCYCWDEVK